MDDLDEILNGLGDDSFLELSDEDPMEFLRDVSPKETCDKLHSRYSEKSPLDKQILLNARKQTKASIVTAVSAAPTNATAAPADASDEDDDGEIFFGSVTALECEKRVESIKAQAQRSQRYNVLSGLPEDLAVRVADNTAADIEQRALKSAQAFQATLETLHMAHTHATRSGDLAPPAPVAPSVSATLISPASDDDDEDEVFFGRVSTTEVSYKRRHHTPRKGTTRTVYNGIMNPSLIMVTKTLAIIRQGTAPPTCCTVPEHEGYTPKIAPNTPHAVLIDLEPEQRPSVASTLADPPKPANLLIDLDAPSANECATSDLSTPSALLIDLGQEFDSYPISRDDPTRPEASMGPLIHLDPPASATASLRMKRPNPSFLSRLTQPSGTSHTFASPVSMRENQKLAIADRVGGNEVSANNTCSQQPCVDSVQVEFSTSSTTSDADVGSSVEKQVSTEDPSASKKTRNTMSATTSSSVTPDLSVPSTMVNSDLLKALQKAKPQKKPSLVTKTSSTQSRVLRQVNTTGSRLPMPKGKAAFGTQRSHTSLVLPSKQAR